MKCHLSAYLQLLLFAGFAVASTGCSPDDDIPAPDTGEGEGDREYTIALAVGSGRVSTTYVQALEDLNEGNISFNSYGFEVPSSRTARIFASEDGESLFDLDYGGGRVYKFDVEGGEQYTQIEETNVEYAIGTTHPRWTKISEDYALLHNVVSEHQWDGEEYTGTSTTAKLVSIGLEDLDLGTVEEFEIPSTEGDEDGDYIFRIDAPIVVGNKAYYGVGRVG